MFDPLNKQAPQGSRATPPTEGGKMPELPDIEHDLTQMLERLGMLNTPGSIESESADLARLVDEALEYTSTPAEPVEVPQVEVLTGEQVESGEAPEDVVHDLGALSGVERTDDVLWEGDRDRPLPDIDPEAGDTRAFQRAEVGPDAISGEVLLAGDAGDDDFATDGGRSGGDISRGPEALPPNRDNLGPGHGTGAGTGEPGGGPGAPGRLHSGVPARVETTGNPVRPGDRLGGHITERQAAWIAARLRVEDDLIACRDTGVTADEVLEWREDPAFTERIATYLMDKRGAFRPLSSHLLPLTWQVIHRLLTSENPKDQKEGVKLNLQVQGLLVNVQETTQSEEIRRLIEDLNRTVPVEIIEVKPR